MNEKIANTGDCLQERQPSALQSVRALRDTLEAQPNAIDAFESLIDGMRSVKNLEEKAQEREDKGRQR